MKKIKLLKIRFSNTVTREQLPAFRSAVIESAGRENIVFHNHSPDGFVYGYPLIQYKHIRKRPSIICLEKAIEEIHHFFQSKNRVIELNGVKIPLEVYRIDANQFTMQVWDKEFLYSIDRWIPFSQKNYADYRKKEYLGDKIRFMESILRGNILSFARGVEWHVDKEIKVKIASIDKRNVIPVKDVAKEVYRLKFRSNVFMPDYIGLGRHTALGFGIVKHISLESTNAHS